MNKIKDLLKKYDELSNRKLLSPEYRDISRLTVQDVEEQVSKHAQRLEKTSGEVKKENVLSEIVSGIPKNQMQNVGDWVVIKQKNREEQVLQGKNTKWCISQTNTQGKTLKDVYRQEYEDIWLQDRTLSGMLDNMIRYMGLGDPNDPEEKFELFFTQQIQQQNRYIGRDIMDDPDPVVTALELLFKQYQSFGQERGDGNIWIVINRNNPFEKYCLIFGIYEFRNQQNETIELKEFFERNDELKEFFDKTTSVQRDVIERQLDGEKLPTYIDIIKEKFNL